MRLAGGETITVTRAHRFLTPTGWSSDIAPGSYVAIPRRLPFADGATPSPVDARFLAWLIAEGWEEQAFRWRRTGSVVAKITQKDRSVLESLVEPARTLGMTAVRIIPPWGGRTAHELYANATVAAERLAALGYEWGRKAARKRIPPFIMRGDAATARAFLRAYVDAEGSVSAQASRSMIEVVTASAGMADDVRTLLRRCGIYARVASKMAHATNGSGIRRTYYRVLVSGSSARRFAAEIGCDVTEKSRRLAALGGVVGNDNIMGIYVADAVARAKEATGLGRIASGNLFASVYASGKQPTMNRATAERLLALLEEQAATMPEVGHLATTVRRRLDADIAFVRVEGIDDVDYTGYVYDLCVAETHNFVADHVVVHNTYMALAALYAAWRRRRERDPQARLHAVVICPTHLVRKWVREAKATIPGVQAVAVDSISEIEVALRQAHTAAPLILVLSKERAKLGHPRRPAVWDRLIPQSRERRLCCPQCGEIIRYTEKCGREGKERLGVPIVDAQVCVRYRLFCANDACRSPLWQSDTTLLRVPNGRLARLQPAGRPISFFEQGRTVKASGGGEPRRVPLGAYIARRLRGAVDVLVLDECHEYKADGSAQGIIAGQLAAAIPQVLALTGTLYGGYASSLFHLLYRLDPATREEFAYSDLARWIDSYGLYEITEKETEREGDEIGYYTRRKTNRVTTRKEIPGLMPQLIARLARHTIFLRLADVAPDLPPYEEHVTSVAMLPAQQRAYDHLKNALLAALREALVKGSKRLLGAYLQSLLAYPDAPYRDEVVTDPKDDHVIAQAPALDAKAVYPKEQVLLDLIAREVGQRRKVLVYIQHTGSRDVTARLVQLLAERHVTAAVLHSSVEAKKREAWVEARLKEGVQVLLAHPKCVQTGLDLLDFPTLVFWQCEYSAYVVGQASRRSWRIGQRHAVHVYHMIYADSLQETALRLVARKRRAAKLVDGDLDEDGLVAQAEMDGLLKELALSLVDEEATAVGESTEDLLAQTHADELADTELIVDALPVDDDDTDEADAAPPEPVAVPAPAAASVGTTISLFDYMAAHPSPTRTGARARKSRRAVPSAQLLLFDLFAGPAGDGPGVVDERVPEAVDARAEQMELFSGAAR